MRAHNAHYGLLLIMAVLSFLSMYMLMYAMVDSFSNVYPNLNQFAMAGLMTAPMIIMELLLMRTMYGNMTLNAAIVIASLLMLSVCFLLIRWQVGITDRQFLKSMIPHHAAALLMCRQASLQDPEIQDLCRRILRSQQAEIDEMKAALRRLNDD